jgi:hypothetical protein
MHEWDSGGATLARPPKLPLCPEGQDWGYVADWRIMRAPGALDLGKGRQSTMTRGYPTPCRDLGPLVAEKQAKKG